MSVVRPHLSPGAWVKPLLTGKIQNWINAGGTDRCRLGSLRLAGQFQQVWTAVLNICRAPGGARPSDPLRGPQMPYGIRQFFKAFLLFLWTDLKK